MRTDGELIALLKRLDGVNVTENPMGRLGVSSLAASAFLAREGIKPIMHVTCANKNRLALQSDVLGACFLGVKRFLALTGDSPRLGRTDAREVFDFRNCFDLLDAFNSLRKGRDFDEREECAALDFEVGAALNPYLSFEELLKTVQAKDAAGADFYQTQPVMSEKALRNLRALPEGVKKKILVGVALSSSGFSSLPGVECDEGFLCNPAEFASRLCREAETEFKGIHLFGKPSDLKKFLASFYARRKAVVENWPVLYGEFVLGDLKSCVGIITVATEELEFGEGERIYAVKGSMKTENLGVERVVVNTLANPNIRFLIVCGEETRGHYAADALFCLKRNGIDEKGRIIGAKGAIPFIENVSREAIERFRKQVELIDLLGEKNPEKITAAARELAAKDPGAFSENQFMAVRIERKEKLSQTSGGQLMICVRNKIFYNPFSNTVSGGF